MPRVIPRLLTRSTACEHLGVSRNTFSRHWDGVFTDPRGCRQHGWRRGVYDDELAAAVEAGGGVSTRAKAAVLLVRKEMGRL